MRKAVGYALLGFVILVATLVIGGFIQSARAETWTWSNPTLYADNTAISAGTQATIKTRIYWATTSAGCATGTLFTTVTNGAATYTGTLPSGAATKGTTSYWCATSSIPGEGDVESIKSAVTSYTVPFVAPGPPSPINVTK